jgi:hypothetical protein
MKFWIGAEIDKSACEAFRVARNAVEKELNERIWFRCCELALTSFDCISVMRGDDVFKERFLYSNKRREMDFRLWMDLKQFVDSDSSGQQAQIFAMLLRAVEILKTKKGIASDAIDKLKSEMLAIGHEMAWIQDPCSPV